MQTFISHILQNKIKQKSFFELLANNYYILIKIFLIVRTKSMFKII